MHIIYCDKCNKKIERKDGYNKTSSTHFFCDHSVFDFEKVIELCEECTEKFSKLIKKFLDTKLNNKE